ncbi:polyamine ABC transporter substrate-binding protein [Derxia gummosa]|uniref:Putrescine-binding periplasmic protein n=1 Tax=Derxia gummosa DSM 723 TaxID=1121388 RepID=A0A8B6X7S0_9BURK|nr:polyamine ABC transporter substrate-binding protein [Derxia gummosa]
MSVTPFRFVRRALGAGIAAALALAAIAAPARAADTGEPKELNIYNWSDYIADDTIANFEKETGIKVRYDNYDSNEVLQAKLRAGKTGYDIVVPGSVFAKQYIAGGLLKPLDKAALTNWGNLDRALLEQLAKVDPGNQYLVDWMWGYVTVGINEAKVKKALGDLPMPENAWSLIFDPKYASKLKSCGISFLDSASEVFPVANLYVGKEPYSGNEADYKVAADMLKSVRPNIRLFSSSGYINDLANGSLCAVMGYSGDINIARQRAIEAKNGQSIRALIPSTGATLFFDTMAIPADAPHPKNAHLFINYILRAEVVAAITNKVFYANPNAASLKFVKKDVGENKTIFLAPEDTKKMIAPDTVSQDIRRVQTRLFTSFKSGR